LAPVAGDVESAGESLRSERVTVFQAARWRL